MIFEDIDYKRRCKKCKDHLGNEYESTSAMCEHYKIIRSTYMNRINKFGWSVEKALTTPTRFNSVYIVNGKKFYSIKSACKHFGICDARIYEKMEKGLTLEQAINSTKKLEYYTVFGVTYRGLSAVYRDYGISTTALKRALKKGITLEDYIKSRRLEKTITIGNVSYKSVYEASKILGVTEVSIFSAMSVTQDPQALELIISQTKKIAESYKRVYTSVDGKEVRNYMEFAKLLGVGGGFLMKNLLLKYTPETLVELKNKPVVYNGIEYNNIETFCKKFNIKDTKFFAEYYSQQDFNKAVEKHIVDNNGKTEYYSCFLDFCKAYKLHNILLGKLLKGRSLQLVHDILYKNNIMFRDVKYAGTEELSTKFKVNRSQVLNLFLKYDYDKAIEKLNNIIVFDHLGNQYSSIDSMAKAYNLNASTVYWRMSNTKMTLEQILTTPLSR